jgi:hypothetical protein
MLAYKDIIRCVANTDKNYFLFDAENNKNKIRRNIFYKNKNKNRKPLKINKEIQNDNKWKISLLFSIMIKNVDSLKSKYKQYYEFLNNFLIVNSEQDKEIFKITFSKVQKIYNILNRFAYNYKFKKTKIVVNTDMCLNELNEGDKNVISIIQNNSKYLFNVKDLINIIDTSLTSSYSFFVQPKKIKNPYNNVAFNKSTLYNIYFFIKFNTNYYSELLYKFFECNFNMGTFKVTYEYMLREYIIKNHVYKSASNILHDEIIYMVEEFNELCMYANITNRIKVDKDFPKDRLIKIMKPYLFLFCKALYSYHPSDKTIFSNYFKKGLLRFSNFNPNFGKKECKLVYKTDKNFVQTFVCEKYFNDNHIPFNNIEKQNAIFLTDHLEYENIQSHTINHNNVENQDDEDDDTVTQEDAAELDDISESDSIS